MNIQIICPGVFGLPDPDPELVPATPAIDRLLGRADGEKTPPRDPLETLAAAFGSDARHSGGKPDPSAREGHLRAGAGLQDAEPSVTGLVRDLPSAVISLFAEAPDLAREGCWFHADPIHLRPDRDRLLLFAGPSLAPRPDEATALVAAFNAHFAEDGLYLLVTGTGRWYLRVPQPPNLGTRPLHEVAGRCVDAYLPTGPDARAWGRWQNEAQMLFFGHPINQARETAGRPVISGIWTWGGGMLPTVAGGPVLTVADHPLGIGLTRLSGGAELGLDALGTPQFSDLAAPQRDAVLVFWDRLWWPALEGDWVAWCAALSELEGVVATLMSGLAGGRIDRLIIDDGTRSRFTLTRASLRRFWRRRGGLSARFADPPGPSARCV
ncbi:MAG TPA: phosphoglycerate mutase [Lamprocystis sp. (in: g-proteobacteria)]|nr:phosphoglycerate mutase [Lamprocystis sp. (in: g-proteobacteria)]